MGFQPLNALSPESPPSGFTPLESDQGGFTPLAASSGGFTPLTQEASAPPSGFAQGLKVVRGLPEAAVSTASDWTSGMAGVAAGGIAGTLTGLSALAAGLGTDKAAEETTKRINQVQSILHPYLVYDPQTEDGKAGKEAINAVFSALITDPANTLGRYVMNKTGSPIAATAANSGSQLATFALMHKLATGPSSSMMEKIKAGEQLTPQETAQFESHLAKAGEELSKVQSESSGSGFTPLAASPEASLAETPMPGADVPVGESTAAGPAYDPLGMLEDEKSPVAPTVPREAISLTKTRLLKAPDGGFYFGAIDIPEVEKAGLPQAPIMLHEGNDVAGKIHIELGDDGQRLAAITGAGYPDVEHFIDDVGNNYNEIWYQPSNNRLLAVKRNGKAHLAVLELADNGNYYTPVTGGIFNRKYPEKGGRTLLWRDGGQPTSTGLTTIPAVEPPLDSSGGDSRARDQSNIPNSNIGQNTGEVKLPPGNRVASY